jgi:hypothetical protein
MNKRKFRYAILSIATASMLSLGLGGVAHATPQTSGTYERLFTPLEKGYCVTSSDNVTVVLHRCQGTSPEEWYSTTVMDGGFVRWMFRRTGTDSCMAVPSSSGGNGSAVILATCNTLDNRQYWSDSYSNLRSDVPSSPDLRGVLRSNRAIGKCLDVENGQAFDGLPLQMWDCNFNTKNQAFYEFW